MTQQDYTKILELVMRTNYGIMAEDLKGKSRKLNLVFARSVVYNILHSTLAMPYREIAEATGYRDRITVMHFLDRWEADMLSPEYYSMYNNTITKFKIICHTLTTNLPRE